MDEGSLSSFILLVGLAALHGTVVISHAALVNSRHGHLREQAEAGNHQAERALRLIKNASRLNITTQLSLTLLRVAIVAIAIVLFAEPLLVSTRDVTPSAALEASYAAILLPLALLVFILAELVPATVGSAQADRFIPLAVNLLEVLSLVLSPVVAVLARLSQSLSRVSAEDMTAQAVTEEEIMSLVDVGQKGGVIEDEEKEMIYSVLQFGETLAREVMVPRLDISAVEMKTSLNEALESFIESGHSRLPVYEDEIDNIKGLLYAKDLLTCWNDEKRLQQQSIKDLMRPAFFVPETKRADTLLKELQNRKIHIAIVVDEYGGTAGLVTIEDLIEEIVGDIKDEYDMDEAVEYVQMNPNEYVVDASMNLDDFNDLLETELSNEESDTLGGYIFTYLGRLPVLDEIIEADGLILRVEQLDGRRIRKVHVNRVVVPPAEETPETESEPVREQTFVQIYERDIAPKAAHL